MIKTTREKLYEEIWKEPIYKVCKKYNVSDNAIRKRLCFIKYSNAG